MGSSQYDRAVAASHVNKAIRKYMMILAKVCSTPRMEKAHAIGVVSQLDSAIASFTKIRETFLKVTMTKEIRNDRQYLPPPARRGSRHGGSDECPRRCSVSGVPDADRREEPQGGP